MYQVNLVNAKNHWIGLLQVCEPLGMPRRSLIFNCQTESPYYQPMPMAPAPFTYNSKWNDPKSTTRRRTRGLCTSQTLATSSFMAPARTPSLCNAEVLNRNICPDALAQNYNNTCSSTGTCQDQIVDVTSSCRSVNILASPPLVRSTCSALTARVSSQRCRIGAATRARAPSFAGQSDVPQGAAPSTPIAGYAGCFHVGHSYARLLEGLCSFPCNPNSTCRLPPVILWRNGCGVFFGCWQLGVSACHTKLKRLDPFELSASSRYTR